MSRPRPPLLVAVAVIVVLAVAVAVAVLLRDGPGEGPPPRPPAPTAVPAPPGEPLARIAVAGDTGTGSEAQYATAAVMAAAAADRPFDALLLLGDLIYPDGDADLLGDVVTDPFAPVLDDGTVLLPVLGNHDYGSGEQSEILAGLGRDAPWYVEQVGPVRVVVLDSNRVADPGQTRWLRTVLAQPQKAGEWTVAAMHHPAYSAGHHGSDEDVQAAWSPLFAAAGVDLVLAGHDHDYQRSSPQGGVTYVVSGAGAKSRRAGRDDFTVVSSSRLHFVDLMAYPDLLVVRALDHDGGVLDSFALGRREARARR